MLFVLCLSPLLASADDWPQFLGHARNCVYSGPALRDEWDDNGPKIAWQKKTGFGFASPVVADGRLILFQRIGNQEIVECLSVTNGETLWKYPYPVAWVDPINVDKDTGPRSTPAISDGKVYSLGMDGMLLCLDLQTGAKIWSANTRKDYHADRAFFGLVCSPLIEGDSLLLGVGATNGMGIAAFDKKSGALLWKCGKDKWSASSPVCATIDGKRYGLFITRKRLLALDPANGRKRFEYPWSSRDYGAVAAASPVVLGDSIILSAHYNMGTVRLRVKPSGDGVEPLWHTHELSAHYQTGLVKDGFLYAPDGHQMEHPTLCCIDLSNGQLKWRNQEFGDTSMLLVNDDLLLLTARGELIFAPASPKEFKVKARAQILPHLVRAYPAISNGYLFARATGELVCVDLRK